MFYSSPVKIWRNQKKIAKHLGKIGVIKSFTIIRIPPAGFEKTEPYAVVLVKVEGKENLVGQLTDSLPREIKTGQKVKTVLRRIKKTDREGIIPYGIKFKLIC